MDIDSASSAVFTNIPLEVLVPFAVDCAMRVAGDLCAILAPVAEWLEYCTQTIVTMADLMRAVAM